MFKFGGASVKDADAVRNVAKIVDQYDDKPLVVVISAMGKTTNALELLLKRYFDKEDYLEVFRQVKDFHFQIMDELFPQRPKQVYDELESLFLSLECYFETELSEDYNYIYDQVVSYGELFSTRIVQAFLVQEGIKSRWIDARNFIITDNRHREGRINWNVTTNLIRSKLEPIVDRMPVLTQGFIGSTPDHHTTTLGREGSDFTAAIFAHTLEAEEVVIWKDVPGVLNADPKRFTNTRLFEHLSYEEAIEMTYYGATVLHPKTIKPLENKDIPLRVRSFLNLDEEGTLVTTRQSKQEVPVIILKRNQLLFSLSTRDYSFIEEQHMSQIFQSAAQVGLKLNVMQKSAISFSFCTDSDERKVSDFMSLLEETFTIEQLPELELLTIRHYTPAVIERMLDGAEVLLEQKTGETIQLVVPEGKAGTEIVY